MFELTLVMYLAESMYLMSVLALPLGAFLVFCYFIGRSIDL